MGIRALLKGPTADLILAATGLEPPTLRVPVMYLNYAATGCSHR